MVAAAAVVLDNTSDSELFVSPLSPLSDMLLTVSAVVAAAAVIGVREKCRREREGEKLLLRLAAGSGGCRIHGE